MGQTFIAPSTIHPWFTIFETRCRLKVFPDSGVLLFDCPYDNLVRVFLVPLCPGPPSHELRALIGFVKDTVGAIVTLTAELLDTWVC